MSSHRTCTCIAPMAAMRFDTMLEDGKLISLRAENIPSNSPMNSSVRCKRTLSYVMHIPGEIDRTRALMSSPDGLDAITTTRTPVPGTPARRAREAAPTRSRQLFKIQRDPLRRARAAQPTVPRREDLGCHIVQSNPRGEATAKGHEQEQRHRGDRAAETKARQQEEARAGRRRRGQGKGRRCCVLEDTRPTAARLLAGD
jgi:hypothetical protein